MKAQEAGKIYNVVIGCSLRPPAMLTADVIAEFNRTFPLVRSLPCDVPLGDHPAQYNMQEKFAKLEKGASNPFIDRAGCKNEVDIEEAMFRALLQEQRQTATR
jgi:metallo-beta-lactamase class B